MTVPTNHNCPDDEVLQELAAGICLPDLADQAMQHISRCASCGPTLRRYVREFSSDVSPENAQILQQLRSSSPQWQRDLVRGASPRKRRMPWLKLAPTLAALALMVFSIVWGPAWLSEFKLHRAQNQAVAGFEERRTTEMRLTAENYSSFRPFPIVLGASESGRGLDEVPTSLHDASGAANQNLRAPQADPRWLQVQGRVLLWESTPSSLEKAEKDFEKARAEGLDVPSLDIDLAVSYFERDSRADHPNLQRTLNLLNQVLNNPRLSNSDRATALYNLAIAYEKTQAWDLAATTWEEYLKLEPSGQWAEEARRRLKAAREKLPEKQQGYLQPAFFLDQLARQTLKSEDPEQYQQKALSLWLPVAMADKNSDAYRAVNGLAEVFAEHQDFWWRDFLAATGASDMAAVRELSDALKNNEQGRYDEAVSQSHHAGMVFARHGNLPAQLLAGFAEVYAVRNKLHGEECLMRVAPFLAKLSGTSYSWLHAQLLLETAQCRNFQVDLADSDNDANQSLAIADKADFPVQKLRILGISAGMKHQQGRCNESWTLSVEGLGQYWKGSYPAERLDQFYSVMWQCASETGSLFLAETLLSHTIAMREATNTVVTPNKAREGMLHLRRANILLALKEKDRAEEESKKGDALLKGIDQSYVKDYVLRTKIEPAELQLQHGDALLALATLQPVERLLQTVQDKFITLSFYRVLGNIYWERRQLDNALAAYQAAIRLAEGSLANLKDGPERLAWLRSADESYRGLVRVLIEQKKTSEALDRWEWYQGRPLLQHLRTGYGAVNQKADAPFDGDTASDNSAPVNVRVSYAIFKDGLQIWVRNGASVQGAWVDLKQDDFERAAHEFVERCADPDSRLNDLQEQGVWLYSKLLQPIIPYLAETKIVTVELDRSFYNLPMEALRSPDGRYFGEQYWIAYSPGTQTEQRLRFPARINRQAAVMVLDASRAPDSGYLPGIEAQRDAIKGIFPRTNSVDSMGTTWPRLQQQLATEAIVHYMGHGRQDGSGTALAFSKSRSLAAKDFAPGLFPRTQLVVLAACSTGKGSENGLWDANNLVHALLAAGVPQIVATHWNVDSNTTSIFMISFYQNLGSGRTVVESAFAARKDILANLPHPYYWAGFSVSGRVN